MLSRAEVRKLMKELRKIAAAIDEIHEILDDATRR